MRLGLVEGFTDSSLYMTHDWVRGPRFRRRPLSLASSSASLPFELPRHDTRPRDPDKRVDAIVDGLVGYVPRLL